MCGRRAPAHSFNFLGFFDEVRQSQNKNSPNRICACSLSGSSLDVRIFGIGGSGYEFFLKGARRAPFKKNSYLKSATPDF